MLVSQFDFSPSRFLISTISIFLLDNIERKFYKKIMRKHLTNPIFKIINNLVRRLKRGGQTMGSRLEELVVYIAHKSSDDLNFGKTKLNKILFAADFFHYGLVGKTISSSQYMHEKAGPVPTAMLPVLNSLEASGRIKIQEEGHYGFTLKRVVPLSEADVSSFTESEIAFLDRFIEKFKPFNGTDLTEWTHKLIPWLITSKGDPIPLESVFVLNYLPVERDGLDWAKEELKRLREQTGYAH